MNEHRTRFADKIVNCLVEHIRFSLLILNDERNTIDSS